ncbi:MAG: metalloenzyme [Firmicutes bacterium]|nr:metalloenzyme [Bacillota bacterium]
MRIIMVFLDGVGLGADDPRINPLARPDSMPFLARTMGRKLVSPAFPWENEKGGGVPVDPILGVTGLPQSATGQASLLTGLNAQAFLGRHQNGFPGRALRQLIAEASIFRRLEQRGRRALFANAFTAEYFAAVAVGRWRHSATTLAALAGGRAIRLLPDLLAGLAVYQDITCASLRERGYPVPLVSPREAGTNLARLAREADFVLFEYFQTDLVGHAREMELALARLGEVDAFLAALMAETDPEEDLVVIASDHGNIEDLGVPTHTANPVPVLAFGNRAQNFLFGLARLDEIAPRVLAFLA